MARYKLNGDEITAALAKLPGWQVAEGRLHKTYKFNSFAAAIGWMVTVAIYADKLDHHPEWSNIYNRVTVTLTTHDMGNVISNFDIALAEKMEAIAS